MTFGEFERLAHRLLERIPRRFREGVDGLTVHRRAVAHPRFHDVYTLGECATESFPASYGGPDSIRSIVHLYWGSFRALSELDGGFDWREQVWETLTHELRHHLESLADRDDLGGVDYAVEQEFRRSRGESFDPHYYRSGDRLGPGVYAVEDQVYIEQRWKPRDFASATAIAFPWAGQAWEVGRPEALGDIHFVRVVDGMEDSPYIDLVLVRAAAWLAAVRRRLSGRVPVVLESDAVALPRRG